MNRRGTTTVAVCALLGALVGSADAATGGGLGLTAAQKKELDRSWQLTLGKIKGPYTKNYCVCQDGQKKPVQLPDGRIVSPCAGNPKFCAAFREPWAKQLADERMYIANLFSRDLWQWDDFSDHHDLVRGYILEKFFVETHPKHKLAEMRAYGGLAGAEFEARDAPIFFERYLGLEGFTESRHYLLAYDLQRRFYVRAGMGDIVKVRNLASAIHRERSSFKPLRDAVHNQISAALVPRIRAYREDVPAGGTRERIDELIREIETLTKLDESAMNTQLAEIEDPGLRDQMTSRLPGAGASDLEAVQALADLMVGARQAVDAKQVTVADRRRAIDLAIMASTILQQRSSTVADASTTTARDLVALLGALVDASFGTGLLTDRERTALGGILSELRRASRLTRADVERALAAAARAIEWAQATTLYAFEEVRAPWNYLVPDTVLIADDVLRGSPLLVYGRALTRLENWAVGGDPIRHDIFGASLDQGVRALNPGLARGPLKVAPVGGDYSRNHVVALPETPADLEPAAGILTRGEGNVVSHVQLLARALGIPNVVLAANVYEKFAAHDGRDVFFISTPGGRVVVKDAAGMTAEDKAVLAEYTRNEERGAEGTLDGGTAKLHIDKERLDLTDTLATDLATMRRAHSGIRCGPKAAFLGELKHLFPDKVARGVVVPFGAYHAHYKSAQVAVPSEVGAEIATAGEPLPAFVERTYAEFFDKMIPSGTGESALATWIRPRLAVIRHSLERKPLSDDLRASIESGLARLGLLDASDPAQTVGVFIRSDTNVEDLDNFNGAGLNLTLFNRRSLAEVYAGLKEVWASPFTYRSFSWRQTLIDEPLWVLPSVIILESVATEKSGVLVTADVEGHDEQGMLIATSEGVGGAVDGTPAETIVWSKGDIELVTMFKSPFRRLLQADGGTEIVPSTGKEFVLDDADIRELTSTAETVRAKLAPSLDARGKARPWDIEFGFSKGKLWLFQVRPFVGNDSLQNVAALRAFEAPRAGADDDLNLDEAIP